jgi:RND family efflux transporter MFP subunit
MQLSMNSFAWPIAAVLIALIFGTYATVRYVMHEPRATSPTSQPEIEIKTGPTTTVLAAPATSPARTQGLVVSGYIAAKAPIVLAASPGSRIAKLDVDIGDHVTKGQVVAELDDSSLRMGLVLAEAHRRAVAGVLEDAKARLAAGAATKSDVDSATSAVDIASAEVGMVQQKIAATKIHSPVDGTILEVLARPGEAVAANNGGAAGVMRIADLSALVAEVDVVEADVKHIAADQYAEVTTSTAPGKPYPARVREIATESDRSRGTVLVRAYLDPSANADLKPGMAVQVRFLGTESSPRPSADAPVTERWGSDAVIDITQENVALDKMLMEIAKTCKLALVVPDYVKSSISATTGTVPCSSAFETFLQSAGLDYRYDKAGHIAHVGARHDLQRADEELAERRDTLAKLHRKMDVLPSGATMNFDSHNAPLPGFLMLLAHAGNVKLVLPDYVKNGTVTIVGEDVPWDAALRAVLAANNLDFRYTEHGRLVRIGTVHDLMAEEREDLERR